MPATPRPLPLHSLITSCCISSVSKISSPLEGPGPGGRPGQGRQDCHRAQRRRRGGDGAAQHHPRRRAQVSANVPAHAHQLLASRAAFLLPAACVHVLLAALWVAGRGAVDGQQGGKPVCTCARFLMVRWPRLAACRLGRCANIVTGEDSPLPRVKPFKVRSAARVKPSSSSARSQHSPRAARGQMALCIYLLVPAPGADGQSATD